MNNLLARSLRLSRRAVIPVAVSGQDDRIPICKIIKKYKQNMRLAVLSDIHGNLEAFRQILAGIEKSDIDAVISLGDNIGYGPKPEQKVYPIIYRRTIVFVYLPEI